MDSCAELERKSAAVPEGTLAEEAHYYRYQVFAGMERLRSAADALEVITGASYWPYPSYSEILYSVR